MRYKHIPGGTVPHFDCGFERRPYFAEPGGWLNVGCRVDEGAERVALELFSEEGWRLVAGGAGGHERAGTEVLHIQLYRPGDGRGVPLPLCLRKGESGASAMFAR